MALSRLPLVLFFLLLCVSCEELLEESDITENSLEILAPTEGVVLPDSTVRLSWSELTGASAYHLQLARPDFDSAEQILLDTVVTPILRTVLM